jgi:hypothetical protein
MFEALANYIRWALEMIQLGESDILRYSARIFSGENRIFLILKSNTIVGSEQ